MTCREAYHRLALTSGCGPRVVNRLLSQGISIRDVARRLAKPTLPVSDQDFVTPACLGYPLLLKEIADPPLTLFHKGRPLETLGLHCVAIVGSRTASRYGVSWSRRLGRELARHGISVCSGLALGIDAAAHEGALEVARVTEGAGIPVAVLGHGWDHVYPPQNLALRQQIERYGILLSEYPPAHPPSRWTFPERNRIIAGLCQTVVVVEAGPLSGSLHTARFANEAGRDVWVIPHRPGTPNSAGVLGLLRDGAAPMFDIEEFVAQLVDQLRVTYPVPVVQDSSEDELLLSSDLISVLTALAQDDEGRLSMLCQTLGRSPSELSGSLAELELLGHVERRFDGTWSLLRWDLVSKYLQLCREGGCGSQAA